MAIGVEKQYLSDYEDESEDLPTLGSCGKAGEDDGNGAKLIVNSSKSRRKRSQV